MSDYGCPTGFDTMPIQSLQEHVESVIRVVQTVGTHLRVQLSEHGPHVGRVGSVVL